MVQLYICDPDKNKECSKTACYINGGPCRHTDNVNYALYFKRISEDRQIYAEIFPAREASEKPQVSEPL